MVILWTVLVCLALFIVQAWVLPLLLMVVGVPFIMPSHLVVRTIRSYVSASHRDQFPGGPFIEDFAAEHPWRIHLAAFLFRWGCIAREVVAWGVVLSILYLLSERIGDAVSWWWVYGLSFLIFLQAFNNARTLNSQYNSLSFRLRGGTSELRYQHGQRDLPPDEVLQPIPVKRHGF